MNIFIPHLLNSFHITDLISFSNFNFTFRSFSPQPLCCQEKSSALPVSSMSLKAISVRKHRVLVNNVVNKFSGKGVKIMFDHVVFKVSERVN